MDNNIIKIIEQMTLNPPASEESLKDVEEKLGCNLPSQYKEFLLESNGAEGLIGSSYLVIWPIDDIVISNQDYEVEKYTPGLIYFGSDGGGEAYAFDSRTKEMPIVEFPFESIHIEDAELCGKTFYEFLQNLYCRIQ
ncbi:MAG: SMI1/KNR4 family protein [Clostridiales bacterium]|nr:SMI1/KNR4 family protein [Clostridiales bacterium]